MQTETQLRELLKEARDELVAFINHQYPTGSVREMLRNDWERDMGLVNRIDVALGENNDANS